jgi:outer membrane protein TolC
LAVGLFVPPAFADLSLRDAILLAEGRRPAIQAAEARVRSAYAVRSQLGAYLPTRLEFGDGTTPDNTSGGEDFLLAQPVDLYGRVSASRASGQSQVEAAEAALAQARLDVQTEVVAAFTQAYSDEELVKTAVALEGIASAIYDATKKRVDAGDLAPAQLLSADLERERARQTLAVRRLGARGSMAKLAAALGLGRDAEVAVGGDLTLAVQRALDAGVAARPDLRSAAADVHSANADVRISDLATFPDVELQFRRAPWQSAESYAFRFQVVFPIWDHGAAHNRSKAAKALREAAERTLEDKRRAAQADVVAARRDYEAADLAVRSFEKLKSDAEALVTKQRRGYELGGATLLDVLDATRSLREIEEGAIDARVKLALASAALLAATGEVVK